MQKTRQINVLGCIGHVIKDQNATLCSKTAVLLSKWSVLVNFKVRDDEIIAKTWKNG